MQKANRHGRHIRIFSCLTVAAALLGGPVQASEFLVQGTNTNSGAFAARVEVNLSCDAGNAVVPDGPISESPSVEPCGILTANDVDIVSGSVRFRAGEAIEFGDGFSVSSAADFTAETGEAVLGAAAYVRDESPEAVTEYYLGFHIDSDGLALTQDTHDFEHLVAYDSQGEREFLVGVTYHQVAAELRLYVTAFEDDGTARSSKGLCELALGSGWQAVGLEWTASTGSNGDLVISLDGGGGQSLVQCLGLGGVGLDNDTGEISAVEWGVKKLNGADLGSIDLDDFTSFGPTQNLVSDPTFDDPTLVNWPFSSASGIWEWDSLDLAGPPGSGSGKLTNNWTGSPVYTIVAGPCIDGIDESSTYDAHVWVYFPGGQGVEGEAWVQLVFFEEAGCRSGLANVPTGKIDETVPDEWRLSEARDVTPPAGAASVRFLISLTKRDIDDPLTVHFDDAMLAATGAIFSDGFESGDTSAWSGQ